ncbi:unnamed protein product [Trichobilharzia regenti]|nr:unnamed protein product [Trichobilharzia regenti]
MYLHSPDSVVSNDHVYCELIKLQTDKNSINHQSDKIMHKRHNSTHHSTCSLRSSSEYNKYHISDGYSDLCSSQSTGMKPTRQPPRLPTRNYGESTLNMVANKPIMDQTEYIQVLKCEPYPCSQCAGHPCITAVRYHRRVSDESHWY